MKRPRACHWLFTRSSFDIFHFFSIGYDVAVKTGRIVAVAGLLVAGGSLNAVGGRHKGPVPTTPASGPSTAANAPATQANGTSAMGGSFTKQGIRLTYPQGWKASASKDYELFLKPAGPEFGDAVITLDIPDLPFHVPGMIPMGMVINGYVDDLKKQAGLKLQTVQEPLTVAGVEGKRLRSTWTKEGILSHDTALVIVHADHVYILRIAGNGAEGGAAKEAFEQMIKSIQWVK